MRNRLMTTAAVIAMAGTVAAQTSETDQMRDMTAGVLAGIRGATPVTPQQTGTDQLRTLVQQAVSEGQSDAYLEALISEAADRGDIEVPDAMRTTEGAVDTRTLLASLVSQSLGTPADDATVATLQAEAETPAESPAEPVLHVVASGESLAGISQQYYGTVQSYDRIFEANRDQLASPDLIRVGQRLVIPR